MALLASLRHATSTLHQRLDSGLAVDAICASEAGLADYLDGFHEALERCWPLMDWDRLERLGLGGIDQRRERYARLGDDLRHWGRGPAPLGPAGSSSDARTVGVAYVLEGSVHGGQAILSRAESTFGPLPRERRRFLSGFGADTPRHWAAFVGWLGSLPDDPGFERDACDAARWAFGQFIDHLQPRPSVREASTP